MPLARFLLIGFPCRCFLFVMGVLSAFGQIPPGAIILPAYESQPVRVIDDQGLGRTWRVVSAKLRENLTATWGVLNVQNASATAIEQARFSAEYYDANGRLCFTLVFAGEANGERDTKPIVAGASRELTSLAAGLGPAAKPVEVRLRLVSQRVVGRSTEVVAGDRLVRSPVTLSSLSSGALELNLNSTQRVVR